MEQNQNIPPIAQPQSIIEPLIVVKKEHHFLSSIIFFFSLLIIYIGVVYFVLGSDKLSSYFFLGAIVITFALSLVFGLVSFIIGKISKRFGKFWKWILWSLVLISMIIGGWSLVNKNKPYVYTTPGSVFLSDKKINLEDCISSNDQNFKLACGMNLAVEMKDPGICDRVHGFTDAGGYCRLNYDEYFNEINIQPITDCARYPVTEGSSSFYRDGCYMGIAMVKSDKKICQFVSNVKSCELSIDINTYNKTYLCGALFTDKHIPGASECSEYVYGLRDVKMCSKLSADWQKEECIEFNKKPFDKKLYDASKNSSKAALLDFNKHKILTECRPFYPSYGQCEFYVEGNKIVAKFKNTLTEPIFVQKEGIKIDGCSSVTSKINNGDYFGIQLEKSEEFILDIQCLEKLPNTINLSMGYRSLFTDRTYLVPYTIKK